MQFQIQKRFFPPALFSALAGLSILIYRGPGWVWLRYYGGDIVAVAFLYFTLSLFYTGSPPIRFSIIATIALFIELAQLFHLTPPNGSLLSTLVFGSNFDYFDLLAYILGLFLAVAYDLSSKPTHRS
ncbi:MAG TPA: DUF2809 domain-containing protein [Halomicronema sp.]